MLTNIYRLSSQQEVFKSHSYARHFTRLQGAKGRSVGVASAGYRPKTAPVTWHSKAKPDQVCFNYLLEVLTLT